MKTRTGIEFATAVILMVLILAAQLRPSSPLFWLASLSIAFMAARFALVMVLLWFVVRTPERTWLRVSIGLTAAVLLSWLADMTFDGTVGLVDFFTLSPAATALILALLESKPKDQPFKSAEIAAALLGLVFEKTQVLLSWGAQLAWLLLTDFGIALINYATPSAPNLNAEIVRRRKPLLPAYYPRTGWLMQG